MRSGLAIDASVLLGVSTAPRDDSAVPTPWWESYIHDRGLKETKIELAEAFTPTWGKG